MTLFTSARPAAHKPSSNGLTRMYNVWRQRQALRALDDKALTDIGLSYREARDEARRPVWDAPANWIS